MLATDMIGSHLGPYKIEAPIGAGGMGEVFRAHDTRLRRTVALPQVLAGLGLFSLLNAGCLFWLQRLQPLFFTVAVGSLLYQLWIVRRRPATLRRWGGQDDSRSQPGAERHGRHDLDCAFGSISVIGEDR